MFFFLEKIMRIKKGFSVNSLDRLQLLEIKISVLRNATNLPEIFHHSKGNWIREVVSKQFI